MESLPQVGPRPDESRRKTKPKATRAQRKRWAAKAKVRQRKLRQSLAIDADAILTFNEWIALNRLSERQGRRILAASGGPVVTKLTDRKIGISRRANRAWLESRARAR